MKKFCIIVLCMVMGAMFTSCGNWMAQENFEREARAAKYQSEYATTVNKLEMEEGNFGTYRRVTFYNVRLGEIVFACEGHIHVQIDKDGDVELVVKTGPKEYLRHYLGQKQDITYFSEQLDSAYIPDDHRYRIMWNPNKWIPTFEAKN